MNKKRRNFLSGFFVLAIMLTLILSSINVYAKEPGSTESTNQTPDLFELDINNDSAEVIDNAIFSNNMDDVAAWISSLSDSEIQTLLDKDTMLAKNFQISCDVCQEDGVIAGTYDTALDFYQKLAKCKHVNGMNVAAEGYGAIGIYLNGSQISGTNVIYMGSSTDYSKKQECAFALSGNLSFLYMNNGAAGIGASNGENGSSSCHTYQGAGSSNYIYSLCYFGIRGLDRRIYTTCNKTGGDYWFNPCTAATISGNTCSITGGSGAITGANNGLDGGRNFYLFMNVRDAMVKNHITLNLYFVDPAVNLQYNGASGGAVFYGRGQYISNGGPKAYEQTFSTDENTTLDFATTSPSCSQREWMLAGTNATCRLGESVDALFQGWSLQNGSTINLVPIYNNDAKFNAPTGTGSTFTVTYDMKDGSTGVIQEANKTGTQTLKGFSCGSRFITPGQKDVPVSSANNWVAQWENPKVTLATLTKKGYNIANYTIVGADGKEVKNANANEEITLSQNVTATANWKPNTYKVKLDVNSIGTNSDITGKKDTDTFLALAETDEWKNAGWKVSENQMYLEKTVNYDEEFKIPTPIKSTFTTGDNNNGSDEVTTTYSFAGWSSNYGVKYTDTAINLTDKNGEEVILKATWTESTSTKPYTPNDDDKPIIVELDKTLLNNILARLDSIQKASDLTAEDLNGIKKLICSFSSADEKTVSKLVDLISNSSSLTNEQKMLLLKHLANGYLTEDDRALLQSVINSSGLSASDKTALLKLVSNYSYLSYEEQQKLLDALNAGSSATLKTSDGVEYIFSKGADGMLTVALKSLNGVSDLIIPNSVTLAGTTYPVTKIAANTFKGNTELRSVTIPGNVTEIGDSAFEGCKNLATVNTTTGLQTIGAKAFKGCISLTTFTCPKTVKTIGNSAFEGCTKLVTVSLNNGLVTIGKKAFYGCGVLKKVTIPKTVLKIGDSAYAKCKKLKTVKFAMGSQCQTLGAKTFKNDVSLKAIKLPKKINKIHKQTFSGCKKLASVKGMAGVTDIGASAFEGCKSLKSITLQKKTQTIGNKAFYDCKKLKTVTIKSHAVTKVGSKAFKKCKSGIRFKVPDNKISAYTRLLNNKY